MTAVDVVIGERVHAVMWRSKVSQVALARQLGLTQTAVSKKVHGDRPWFVSELLDVAAILHVPVSTLLPEAPPAGPPAGPAPARSANNADYSRAARPLRLAA